MAVEDLQDDGLRGRIAVKAPNAKAGQAFIAYLARPHPAKIWQDAGIEGQYIDPLSRKGERAKSA